MARVTHFEIHATEPATLIKFYTELFGWKFQQWGAAPYWLIETGPATQAGIDGGMGPRRGAGPKEGAAVNSYVCTVQVETLDDSLAKALSLGACIAVPKMPVSTIGWLAYAKDPDGNIFGLMQPDPHAR
jgi:predicted enzyme related to lactoylglutathione lyase